MGEIQFFAAREDLLELVDWIVRETDFRIFESSRIDQPCRSFPSSSALDDAHRVGSRRFVALELWSPSVTKSPGKKRLKLNPDATGVVHVRHEISGFGIAQLQLGATRRDAIGLSRFAHNSKSRAAKWQSASGIAWAALERLGRAVRKHVTALATKKADSYLVLPGAAARMTKEPFVSPSPRGFELRVR